MVELVSVVDDVPFGLGEGVNRVESRQHRAYQGLRHFACLCPPQCSKLLIYLTGFTRDVTVVGHPSTGDRELQRRSEADLGRAQLQRAEFARGTVVGQQPAQA